MNSIKVVAWYTFKELFKSRILINTFFLGCALITICYIASEFTYGTPGRIAIDFGLGTLTLSSVGISLFLGVSLISKELETKTVYMVISRPVTRTQFLIGKIIGFLTILFLNLFILSTMALLTFKSYGGVISPLIIWNIFYTFLESCLVLLIVVLFTLNTNNTVSVISALVLYIVGHSIDPRTIMYFVEGRPGFEALIKFYHFVLPGFYKFNIKDFVIYKQELEIDYLISSLSYGLIYSLFVLFLIIFVFNKKDIA